MRKYTVGHGVMWELFCEFCDCMGINLDDIGDWGPGGRVSMRCIKRARLKQNLKKVPRLEN